jgi:hypothetical protein
MAYKTFYYESWKEEHISQLERSEIWGVYNDVLAELLSENMNLTIFQYIS